MKKDEKDLLKDLEDSSPDKKLYPIVLKEMELLDWLVENMLDGQWMTFDEYEKNLFHQECGPNCRCWQLWEPTSADGGMGDAEKMIHSSMNKEPYTAVSFLKGGEGKAVRVEEEELVLVVEPV